MRQPSHGVLLADRQQDADLARIAGRSLWVRESRLKSHAGLTVGHGGAYLGS